MKLTRILAALFVAASLSLAVLVPRPAGGGALLAAASSCGAYDGPLCKSTTSCVWYVFGSVCTTTYDYYKSTSDGGGGGSNPTQPETDLQ